MNWFRCSYCRMAQESRPADCGVCWQKQINFTLSLIAAELALHLLRGL